MGLKEIWSGLVSNLLSAGLILVFGLLLGFVRLKWPSYSSPVLYAAAGAACLSIIWFAFTGQAVLSKKQPQTTGTNIEANVRAWADSLGLGIKKERAPETDFLVLITVPNGTTVAVFKSKERPKNLSFQVNIGFSPEHAIALGKLSVNQIEMIARDLTLELSRINIGYKFVGPPFTAIMLVRGIPIGSSITEATFAACLDQMDNATQVAKVAFALSLERETGKLSLPQPT